MCDDLRAVFERLEGDPPSASCCSMPPARSSARAPISRSARQATSLGAPAAPRASFAAYEAIERSSKVAVASWTVRPSARAARSPWLAISSSPPRGELSLSGSALGHGRRDATPATRRRQAAREGVAVHRPPLAGRGGAPSASSIASWRRGARRRGDGADRPIAKAPPLAMRLPSGDRSRRGDRSRDRHPHRDRGDRACAGGDASGAGPRRLRGAGQRGGENVHRLAICAVGLAACSDTARPRSSSREPRARCRGGRVDGGASPMRSSRGGRRVAARWSRRAWSDGDHVGICLGNCIHWVVLFHALGRLGAVTVPVNTRLKLDEIAYSLRQSGASLLFMPIACSRSTSSRCCAASVPRSTANCRIPPCRLRGVVLLGGEVPAGASPSRPSWRQARDGRPGSAARRAIPC